MGGKFLFPTFTPTVFAKKQALKRKNERLFRFSGFCSYYFCKKTDSGAGKIGGGFVFLIFTPISFQNNQL